SRRSTLRSITACVRPKRFSLRRSPKSRWASSVPNFIIAWRSACRVRLEDLMPTEGGAREDPLQKHFCDPDAVARYFEGPQRFVPGLDALHRMTGVLLAERAPVAARVLALGA